MFYLQSYAYFNDFPMSLPKQNVLDTLSSADE